MNRIASAATSAAVLAAALIWPDLSCTPASAQPPAAPEVFNTKVRVDYLEPRKPTDTTDRTFPVRLARYERFVKIYERYKERRVLEEYAQFLAPLRLPTTLRIRLAECNMVNAFYSPRDWQITMCYEWMDDTEQTAPKETTRDGFTRQEVLVGGFLNVFLHETGHALFDILDIPVLGREEDAADQIAGFIMLQFGKEVARTTIKGSAYTWLRRARTRLPAYWDVHGTPAQRFYNYLCIAYGSDPETFKDFFDKGWIAKSRAERCPQEYEEVRLAFRKTLLPHIDQDLMKKVQERKWLRPEDGAW
ncbi:MAG: hypothetical protein QOC56_1115 [Alphaproteobacteria bacterium]|nr:hypothetical protein [Alphaproteobacteria bacterium]